MFTSVESGKPPSPPTYVYIVNTPTRNSATDRYYIISRTAITIYSSTIMKFPSLSIENSNIPKTNCLPITRRRKEKRTIYFHLRFDVSLNDAIDPTGERGGERDPWIPGVAVARRGATGSEPILLWPARWRDSKGR